MRPSFSLIFLSLSFLTILVLAIIGHMPSWVWFIPVGIGVMATLTVFRGVYVPQKAAERGLELINSQDYNNRLTKVGEPNADRIVDLFNSLIDKLRAERLQNRENESLLALLIDASPMGVVMLDFDQKISLTNKSFLKITGINTSEEIEGMTIEEIKSDIIPEMLKVPLGESLIVRKGNFRIYRVYHLKFVQKGFRREFYLLESLTEEIIKAEKRAYEKVIRTISHEVNNTMGGVRAILEIVGESSADPEIKKVVESCDHRCESMGNFIHEYAEVVKIPTPVLQSIDLCREIDLIIPFLQQMVPERIDLQYNLPPEPFIINGDSGLLQQVILNIVKNAVESIKDFGMIKIGLAKRDKCVILTVSNNGSPIDDNTRSNLFTPFFTTKPEGKGIGLTLIREVLTRHEADFSLSTEEDGITRFSIVFKAYE